MEPNRLLASLDEAQRRSVERLSRKALYQERLLEISRRISTLDLDAALALIIGSLVELTGTERGVLMLRDDEGVLRCERVLELSPREVAGPAFDVSRSLVERALARGEVVVVAEVAGSDLQAQPSIVGLGLRALAAIPLLARDRSLGVIYVDTAAPDHRLRDSDPDMLRAFGSQAAIAIDNARQYADLLRDHELLRRLADGPLEFAGMVYRSRAIDRLRELIERLGKVDVTVLIQGETGTGKELVARALHALGPRRDRRFVSLNAGALPDTLVESELFGHRRGAFSSALEHKVGLFEAADGGTVFLDEIGEASPALQVKLLRFLETGGFRRLGETADRDADVRVIAATHRDLAAEAAAGRFRADLYYRLSVFPLRVPPLRERREDVAPLVAYFIDRANARLERRVRAVPPATLRHLESLPWPGNVRELENLIQRQVLLSTGDTLAPLDDPAPEAAAPPPPPEPAPEPPPEPPAEPAELRTLAEVERDHVRRVLAAVGGNQSRAARILGLKRGTLRHRLQKLGLAQTDD